MNLIDRIKKFFNRSKYKMTTSSLNSILDHSKINLSDQEYNRIKSNLDYYKSSFDDVVYTNTQGDSKKRKLNHLPLARTACKKIASLVYNENAEIILDDEVANEFVNDVLYKDSFNRNFERYLESGLALGGLAMRPYVEDDTIKVAFIQAPVFLPLKSNTQEIEEAAIVTKTTVTDNGKTKYYTLLEFHERTETGFVISNELYVSETSSMIGNRVPVTDLYPDLQDVVTLSGMSRPLFTYLKTPGMNNKDINSPLGLSIFDNAKTTIDFINRTYDEFLWEIKMGQRRVAVPESLTDIKVQNENGNMTFKRRFDPEQNVFVQFDMGGMDDGKIVDLTTAIRADDYIKSINQGLALFEMQIGVSAGMFSFDGKSMKTATEIVSENSDTYQMRNSIVSLVEHSIKELVISICELAKASGLYSGNIPDFDTISINLDDGIFTDRNAELDYWIKAVASGLISKKYAIAKILNVTEDEAEEMYEEINEESQPVLSEEDSTIYEETRVGK
ncbi:phage portal protein [Gemella sp. 19428wG2_WT2a]|nr:phage portal protein [Gemella sp. 19428wG2_WT2a]TFU57840.1 phage portal protein [Gemella sp. WT2a]